MNVGDKWFEITGLSVLVLVVFLSLSLITYSPQDPPRSSGTGVENAAGWVGAYLAHYLYLSIGYASWLLVLSLCTFCVQSLFHRTEFYRLRALAGWLFVFLGAVSLLGLYRPMAGGLAGAYLVQRFIPLFGLSGSMLLFGFFLVLGLSLRSAKTIQKSLQDLFRLLGRGSGATTGWLRDQTRDLLDWVERGWKMVRGAKSPRINRASSSPSASSPSGTAASDGTALDTGTSPEESSGEAAEGPGATDTDQDQTEEDLPQGRTTVDRGDADTAPTDADDGESDSSEPVEVSVQRPAVDEVSPSRYELPPLDLLRSGNLEDAIPDDDDLKTISRKLENTFDEFDIDASVVAVNPGPVLTMYEVEPGPGVSVKKIRSRADDIKLSLAVKSVRIVSPIPGKSAVGIEVPNPDRAMVRLRDVLETSAFRKDSHRLPIGLGLDVLGDPVSIDLTKLPHLLIAGATGSGKSVGINTIICSLLYRMKPHHLKFILIDPKRVELKLYDGMPHLMTPVIDDPGDANKALKWAVKEMENRYETLSEAGYRNIGSYNEEVSKEERMPYLVLIVDELADLMLTNPKECEQSITRLAQMARAVGIHMVLATQRPSTDVITGLIKANMPARISFRVSSGTDSRVILDQNGAETLLGNGDFLYLSSDAPNPRRGQGSFLTGEETKQLIRFIKKQLRPSYLDEDAIYGSDSPDGYLEDFEDEYYQDAKQVVVQSGKASASMLQRRFQVGYNRAARMIDAMEEEGIVGPHRGSKARKVLVDPEEFEGDRTD